MSRLPSTGLRPYTVNVGQRGNPRLSFGAMARSSMEAVMQHECLAERGERVEAIPVRAEVDAAQHQLEQARLRGLVVFNPDASDAVDALRRAEAL